MAFPYAEGGGLPPDGEFLKLKVESLKFKEFEAELPLYIICDYGRFGRSERYIDVPHERQCRHDQVPAG